MKLQKALNEVYNETAKPEITLKISYAKGNETDKSSYLSLDFKID